MNNEWSRASKIRHWQEARDIGQSNKIVDSLYVLCPCHIFYTQHSTEAFLVNVVNALNVQDMARFNALPDLL